MEELTSTKSEALEIMAFLPRRSHPRIEVLEPIDFDSPGSPRVNKATREIVAEAGLSTMKRVVAPALLHGLVLAAVVAACGILAYRVGWADERPQRNPEPAAGIPALVPLAPLEDSRDVRAALWGETRHEVRRVPAKRAPVVAARPAGRLTKFYRAQKEKKREIVPRRPDAARLQAAPNIQFRTVVGRDGIPLKTSQVQVRRVALLSDDVLDHQQVRRVVRSHYPRVKSCLERQLKRDPSVSGKLLVAADVATDGRVTRVAVQTPRFQGTFLEECLLKEVGSWKFPNPARKPCQVVFPLLLLARSG